MRDSCFDQRADFEELQCLRSWDLAGALAVLGFDLLSEDAE